jgi:hypothetical protein
MAPSGHGAGSGEGKLRPKADIAMHPRSPLQSVALAGLRLLNTGRYVEASLPDKSFAFCFVDAMLSQLPNCAAYLCLNPRAKNRVLGYSTKLSCYLCGQI